MIRDNENREQDQKDLAEVSDKSKDKDIFARNDSALENLSFGSENGTSYSGNSLEDTSLGFDVIDGNDRTREIEVVPDVTTVKKVKVKKKIVNERGLSIRSLSFTIIYVMAVLILALLLAHFIITRANDAFAFVKDDITVSVTIDNVNMTLDDLADLLHKEGAIKYPEFFKLYVYLKKDGRFGLKSGTYEFSAANNYDVILSKINPKPPRKTITVTIPEGFTTDDIIDLFVAKGIGTREGFVEAINNAELNYWFLEPLKEGTHEERFYRLDGYLYPDTYYFYTNSSEVTVLKKLLNNFNKKFARAYERRCEELGITIDEAIILASIIQCEAKYVVDYEYVSSVLHNRLNNPKTYPRFECDVTLQYYFRHVEGSRHAEITASDLLVESQYNTRRYSGYTPGPICSPSLTAIKAALYPSSTKFYYFISKSNGYLVYSKNYAEHVKYDSMSAEELLKVDQGLYD